MVVFCNPGQNIRRKGLQLVAMILKSCLGLCLLVDFFIFHWVLVVTSGLLLTNAHLTSEEHHASCVEEASKPDGQHG